MKNIYSAAVALLSISILLITPAAGAGKGGPNGTNGNCGFKQVIGALPLEDLNAVEASGLAFTREEEKLAHDVYRALYQMWSLPIFDNISAAEQQHADAAKFMLDRYGLMDPVGENPPGMFTDVELQTLYNEFVATGAVSTTQALQVGATIEDLDIHSLDLAIAATDNTDLGMVYQNLQKGSRNHLRAFVGQLQLAGETYTAQYLDPARIADIIGTPHEIGGMAGAGGQGLCGCTAGNGSGGHRGGPPSTPPQCLLGP